jgi:prophage antirepressor-like protein
MSNLTVFNFESQEVRFVGTADKPWWVVTDVCAVLEIKNPSQAIARLDDDERSMFNIGRQGEAWCVNESGLYSLVLSSRKPQAKRFKKWMTSEVIPSIRKTGSYSIQPQPMTQIQVLASIAQQMADQEQQLLQQEARLAAVEAEQQRYLTPCGHKYTVMGFANLHKISISAKQAAAKGKVASRLCRSQGIEVEQVYDPRFGTVGLYPEDALAQVFKG